MTTICSLLALVIGFLTARWLLKHRGSNEPPPPTRAKEWTAVKELDELEDDSHDYYLSLYVPKFTNILVAIALVDLLQHRIARAKCPNGLTPLHYAYRGMGLSEVDDLDTTEWEELIAALIRYGADPTARDAEGRTPKQHLCPTLAIADKWCQHCSARNTPYGPFGSCRD